MNNNGLCLYYLPDMLSESFARVKEIGIKSFLLWCEIANDGWRMSERAFIAITDADSDNLNFDGICCFCLHNGHMSTSFK